MSIRAPLVHILWLAGVASNCQKSTIHLGPDGTGGLGLGGVAGQGNGGVGGGVFSKPDAGFAGSGGTAYRPEAGSDGMYFKPDAGFGGGGGSAPWYSGGRSGAPDALGPDGPSGGAGGFSTGGVFVTASGGGGSATGGRGGPPGADARPWGGSGGLGTTVDSGPLAGDASSPGSADGPKWSSCYPVPKCSAGEVGVLWQNATVGIRGCACMANPCGTSPPSCNCAASLCGSSATCVDYVPDSGVLACSEKG